MRDTPISPLRRRMIEDMTVRNFVEKTQNDYIRHVRDFTAFLGRSPDLAMPEDLRRFQLHQRENGVRPSTMNSAVSALRFLFGVTLDRDGESLDDIVDLGQNTAAADRITQIVAELTRDQDAALYVSIAGGRKTMGFLLGYALSLFGRAQDRLSHILVDRPFEQHPEFFYPPNPPRVLFDSQQRPVSTADAKLHLAEIPIVRLRHGLPRSMLAGQASYSETVESLAEQFHPPSLRISLKERSVHCHGRQIPMSDILIAAYALFAARRLEGEDAYAAGLPRAAVVAKAEFLDLYAQVVGEASGAFETTAATLDDPIDHAYVDEKASRINKALKRKLGEAAATPYLLTTLGKRPYTRKGLIIVPDAIVLERRWQA